MINQGNNVPDNTIAVFHSERDWAPELSKDRFDNLVQKSPKKRDWFTPHFYRCLPLTIGNQYGFMIKSEFSFSAIWNGGEDPTDIIFNFDKDPKELNHLYPMVYSHFGSGIITIDPPYVFRTPPGINLMTINPPNVVIPNITVMTGVVESDNIRRNFTFNLKMQMPNVEVFFPAGTPLAAFMPIPRNFGDNFNLVWADEIFDEETVLEELQADSDHYLHRTLVEPSLPNKIGRLYFKGLDIYGNELPDHQKP
jgi:hypothetical protein